MTIPNRWNNARNQFIIYTYLSLIGAAILLTHAPYNEVTLTTALIFATIAGLGSVSAWLAHLEYRLRKKNHSRRPAPPPLTTPRTSPKDAEISTDPFGGVFDFLKTTGPNGKPHGVPNTGVPNFNSIQQCTIRHDGVCTQYAIGVVGKQAQSLMDLVEPWVDKEWMKQEGQAENHKAPTHPPQDDQP